MPYTPSYVPYLNRIRNIIAQYNNGALSNNKARMLIYEQVTKARDNGELLSRDLDILESSAYDLVEKLSKNPDEKSSKEIEAHNFYFNLLQYETDHKADMSEAEKKDIKQRLKLAYNAYLNTLRPRVGYYGNNWKDIGRNPTKSNLTPIIISIGILAILKVLSMRVS